MNTNERQQICAIDKTTKENFRFLGNIWMLSAYSLLPILNGTLMNLVRAACRIQHSEIRKCNCTFRLIR